jgi:hypothetical protein
MAFALTYCSSSHASHFCTMRLTKPTKRVLRGRNFNVQAKKNGYRFYKLINRDFDHHGTVYAKPGEYTVPGEFSNEIGKKGLHFFERRNAHRMPSFIDFRKDPAWICDVSVDAKATVIDNGMVIKANRFTLSNMRKLDIEELFDNKEDMLKACRDPWLMGRTLPRVSQETRAYLLKEHIKLSSLSSLGYPGIRCNDLDGVICYEDIAESIKFNGIDINMLRRLFPDKLSSQHFIDGIDAIRPYIDLQYSDLELCPFESMIKCFERMFECGCNHRIFSLIHAFASKFIFKGEQRIAFDRMLEKCLTSSNVTFLQARIETAARRLEWKTN